MDAADLPWSLSQKLQDIDTVSDRIRLLDREGIARADIARILNKRYQHVRNVLEADARKKVHPDAESDVAEGGILRLSVGKDGTLVLPQSVLRALKIPQGGTVSGRLENNELHIAEPLQALRNAQKILEPLRRKMIADGRSLVDELIEDRRAAGEVGG